MKTSFNYDTFSQPCELVEAVMPVADGVIKDCVRIFATENGIDKTAICNDGYALIERGDIVEMFVDEKISALVIKRPVDLVDEEIVGVILRTEY